MTRVMTAQRKCKFIPHWRNLFPWVEYNSDEGNMFCVTCRKLPLHADNSSALYVGSTNFLIELLKTHAALLHTTNSSKIKQELHPTNLKDTRLGQTVIQLHEKNHLLIISHTSAHLLTLSGPMSFNSSMV